jgi:hypothetical protein
MVEPQRLTCCFAAGFLQSAVALLDSNHELLVPVERDEMKVSFKFGTSINRLTDSIALPPYDPRPIHFSELYGEVTASSSSAKDRMKVGRMLNGAT